MDQGAATRDAIGYDERASWSRSHLVSVLIRAAALMFGSKPGAILEGAKEHRAIDARHACMLLLRRNTNMSMSDIGTRLGGTSRQAVHWAISAAEKRIGYDLAFQNKVERLQLTIPWKPKGDVPAKTKDSGYDTDNC